MEFKLFYTGQRVWLDEVECRVVGKKPATMELYIEHKTGENKGKREWVDYSVLRLAPKKWRSFDGGKKKEIINE